MRCRLLAWIAAWAVIPGVCSTTYDYIVVGSGPGGGPLAANLARAGYSTLLIEAGSDEGSNPTYSNIANRFKAVNDEATRWDFWVKHYDDPKLDAAYHHITWDVGNGTFYVGNSPPVGAKVCRLSLSCLPVHLSETLNAMPTAEIRFVRDYINQMH